jgi:uncharacterized protein (DUF2062 family)
MAPLGWFREKSGQLLRLKAEPRAIAVGASVGVFFGFIPLLGLKTLLAVASARLLRGSLIAAAIAVTLHDITLPLAPLLLRWEYDVGYWLLNHPHELPPHLHLHQRSADIWFHWSSFFTVGKPLLLGAAVVAAPLAVLTYYFMLTLLSRARKPQILSAEAKQTANAEDS